MGKTSESGTTKKVGSLKGKIVCLLGGGSSHTKNPGVQRREGLACPPHEAGAKNLLEYCGKRIVAIYAQWERNSR